MNIQAKYLENGYIQAVIDGQLYDCIPDNPANRHRAVIAQWEEEGNRILPYIKPPYEKRRNGEFREFMALFTEKEQQNIITVMQTNTAIKLWYDKALGGLLFSLDHPQTTLGLGLLVDAGVLTKKRKADILNTDFDNILT